MVGVDGKVGLSVCKGRLDTGAEMARRGKPWQLQRDCNSDTTFTRRTKQAPPPAPNAHGQIHTTFAGPFREKLFHSQSITG